MSKSIITESLYNEAVNLINHGYSVRKACAELNIPRTSFRRMVSNRGGINLQNDIEYYVLLKASNYTFIVGGDFYTIDKDSAEFNKKKVLIESLVTRDDFKMNLDEQSKLIDGNLNKTVRDIIARVDDFRVIDGKFFYKGNHVSQDFYDLLKKTANDKKSNLNKFADMLIQNPDENIIYQLHGFISHNDISIDEDGYVITYKSVRYDWLDHHSATMSNKVGNIMKMNREDVDDNPNQTCSHGLHVGSLSYIMQMYDNSNNRIMICKVNPKDFVSIPIDYNFAKARVCEYEVIGELN